MRRIDEVKWSDGEQEWGKVGGGGGGGVEKADWGIIRGKMWNSRFASQDVAERCQLVGGDLVQLQQRTLYPMLKNKVHLSRFVSSL